MTAPPSSTDRPAPGAVVYGEDIEWISRVLEIQAKLIDDLRRRCDEYHDYIQHQIWASRMLDECYPGSPRKESES